MSRITVLGMRCLAIAAVFSVTGYAQQPTIQERAPVPRQVLTARNAFIGNGGSETYGAESYDDLTQYDGGANRAYESFYSAMKSWGHYELVGSTSDADILLVVRFTNPAVARDRSATADVPHDWTYDPQLNLSINDPRTGLPLWTITEHIEPGNGRAENNRHFDEATDRLVDDLQRLILNPDEAVSRANVAPPPGTVAVERGRTRAQHMVIGFAAGGLVGLGLFAAAPHDACNDFNDLHGCYVRNEAQSRNAMLTAIGATIAGALIGWIWPVGQ